MSDFIVTSKRPVPAKVRAWGAEQNAKGAKFKGTEPKTRGRLNPVLIEAYNKTHKGQNAYAESEGTTKSVTVRVKPAKGRAKDVRIDVKAARAEAVKRGLPVGKRGNLPKATVSALILNG